MHEMSICEGVLLALEAEAKIHNFATVKTVWLEIGDLSSVEPEALHFSFDVVTRDSLADGATLKIVKVPGAAWCMQCSESVTIKQRYDECPTCGSHQLQVTAGDEMKIKELEVD
ncbi:MAG: hydrogenase maturation nickel metallochaperone HypA [Gammaproteobacteria bacterium]|nr:hydrogenase maturation nickel metallochaperone HypA [Gammaproteobacteria bacterium]